MKHRATYLVRGYFSATRSQYSFVQPEAKTTFIWQVIHEIEAMAE
jgi:hypothetical protein